MKRPADKPVVRRPPSARPPAPTAEERALFAAALHDAKPLRRQPAPARDEDEGRTSPVPPIKKIVRPAAPPSRKPAAAPNPGIDRSTAEKLRRGEIDIDRRVDLHGMIQDDAHAALDRFVRDAWADGKRMLLVITGKGNVSQGGGVLRQQVPRWLGSGEHAARVLRIAPAQPRHGGSGAYYVLLRRRREIS
ncbi:MAG: Smr/MutS family protein [Rhodospirillales bacterium]|nr:Smr/MutS family protein [Rhodospirillales bacterium]